jgi:hypothetical protein
VQCIYNDNGGPLIQAIDVIDYTLQTFFCIQIAAITGDVHPETRDMMVVLPPGNTGLDPLVTLTRQIHNIPAGLDLVLLPTPMGDVCRHPENPIQNNERLTTG